MPTRISVPSNLLQLASSLQNLNTNGNYTGGVYLYYNNGTLSAINDQNPTITNNVGYQYQFLSGNIIYSLLPITSISNIPFVYPASGLNGNDSALTMWLDGMETYNVNTTFSKIMVKGYSTDLLFLDTATPKFSYSNNTFDLSNSSYLSSQNTLNNTAYFMLYIVFQLPTTTLNTYLFKHNNISIRLSSQSAPDTSTQTMISLFDGNTFIKGISLYPSATASYKYSLYADSASTLIVNTNTSGINNTGTFNSNSGSATVYIGSDASGNNLISCKINEIIYYTNTTNSFSNSTSAIISYLTSRWTISSYSDAHNLFPYPFSYTGTNSSYSNTYSGTTYNIIVIKGNGTLTVTSNVSCKYGYVFGGGGGGQGQVGFGAGAGGTVYFTNLSMVTNTNYTCVVGAGGPNNTAGGNTTFKYDGSNTWQSNGGGAGNGSAGGCSGGNSYANSNQSSYANTTVYGTSGGTGSSGGHYAGGGGALGAGTSNVGGDGIQLNSIFGTAISGITYYATGGAGANSDAGQGGNSSANNNGGSAANGSLTVPNYCASGGCAGFSGINGQTGGSGVIILAF